VPREAVGNWLYGVAHQTAVKLRAMSAKGVAVRGWWRTCPNLLWKSPVAMTFSRYSIRS
jgi:hypothetical protein